jgi:Zn-dependent peptidase ImmA (M78 family)/transcriptional regulator with XRE-family HTH domain
MPEINPEILVWARETAGLTPEEAAEKLGIRDARGVAAVDRLAALETGDDVPTRPMLVKMAKHYRRPLLTFYMSAPPLKGERGRDFRTLPEGHSEAAEALLDALIRDVRARQSMVRALLEDEEDTRPLPYVASMRMSDGVAAVVASIQRTLRDSPRAIRSTNQETFAVLRASAEAAGVFVLLIGNLGSHHTAIDVETFRGFALADKVAPFVVINDQDAQAAWSFTLLHELAHIWLGETGVSGAFADTAIEQFCNRVASKFLLPSEELAELQIDDTMDFETTKARITDFAEARLLSSSMVAYRLYQTGRIEREAWSRLASFFRQKWLQARAERRERARERDGGPSYYVVRRHRVGTALIELVRRTMAEGMLTPSKAGKILGVKPANVQTMVNPAGPPALGPMPQEPIARA